MNSPPSDEAVSGLIFDFERISGEIASSFDELVNVHAGSS